MTSPRSARLSVAEKVAYGLGDLASNLYWKTFEVFILFFYTEVFGLRADVAGTMILVTRVWDAIADPIVGAIADRTSTRWGKFRPYLLWFAVPMALTGVLTFTTPGFTLAGRTAYAYATYTAMMLAYTAINIPYSALMGVMTPDSHERTSLSSFRFAGAFGGGLFVQTFTLNLVQRFGAGDAAAGWARTMAVYGVAACVFLVLTFFGTRERVVPVVAKHRPDLRRDIADLASNRPWVVLFGLGTLVIAGFFIRGGAAAYYFKYYLGREDWLAWFMSSGGMATLAGVSLATPLVRRFGKRNLYVVAMATSAVVTAAMYFVPPGKPLIACGLNAAACLILGPTAPVLWAMYADTADFAEWKTGRRATGLVFAAAMFALKLGGAVGGWGLGVALQAFGYVANAPQTAHAVQGIVLLMTVIPAAFGLVAAAWATRYGLDEATLERVERDLAERRAVGAAVVLDVSRADARPVGSANELAP